MDIVDCIMALISVVIYTKNIKDHADRKCQIERKMPKTQDARLTALNKVAEILSLVPRWQ